MPTKNPALSPTPTATCSILKKAADFARSKSDFELIVRIADRWASISGELVPFGKGVRADMGQSRGAQSGEADRHDVWLIAQQRTRPKMSPLDPSAIFDEIQRSVPGYDVSRLNLFSGNAVHTHATGQRHGLAQPNPELIWPANDTLFTSGTLGRYSNTFNSVMEKYTGETRRGHHDSADAYEMNTSPGLASSWHHQDAGLHARPLGACAYTVWLERKLIGRMQNRWGPTRVGSFGLLQPAADAIKFIVKEDLTPPGVNKPLFVLAPMLAVDPALVCRSHWFRWAKLSLSVVLPRRCRSPG